MAGFAALLLALTSSVACAGPSDKNAASKADGDIIGRSAIRRGAANRSFSYAPATEALTPSTPTAAADNTGGDATSAARPDSSTRSFSYQAGQTNGINQTIRQGSRNRDRFFRADHKALGDY
jgi:hypothetical protein